MYVLIYVKYQFIHVEPSHSSTGLNTGPRSPPVKQLKQQLMRQRIKKWWRSKKYTQKQWHASCWISKSIKNLHNEVVDLGLLRTNYFLAYTMFTSSRKLHNSTKKLKQHWVQFLCKSEFDGPYYEWGYHSTFSEALTWPFKPIIKFEKLSNLTFGLCFKKQSRFENSFY